ncbi:hypothetical protein DFQ05_0994 [Winogradskyella wandonensis]|uniref:Uncharacterized protein n=1 Tax=Winogradskyella wandonensis TaxID=1442586 RepID=A0A4V2PTP1_9FLAO|nr:hypothetical protein [Winogradskyella wandonensis]TCK67221.1 hypothetical protein DFQ05_0994 [Winogradskyella wandonensis]
MKNVFFKIALNIVLIFFISNKLYSNAAQPGVWNAGGTVFTMLHPEDSLSFKKVQMQQEKIYIQLYKGFAVVKGIYWFRNTTKDRSQFKMGYPVNGIYAGGETNLNQVSIDSLNEFKIKANSKWLPLLKQSYPELNNNNKNPIPFSDNWKVWEMTFQPNEIQIVEVYFIVNTNNAQVRKGYNVDNKNTFIYLLESGSVWQSPIENAAFYVQLMDGLLPTDINGISTGFNFKYSEKHKLYIGEKLNFSPTPKDNLVISYHNKEDEFLFNKILSNRNDLYLSINSLETLPKNGILLKKIDLGNPYAVKPNFSGFLPILLTYFVMYLPGIIIAILLIIFIRYMLKRRKLKINS